MKFIWSPEALDDLLRIQEFISHENPRAAIDVVTTIATFAQEQLFRFPEAGREGRVAGTRELVVPRLPFIIPYRVTGDHVEIARVYHTSRRWPDKI